MKAWPPKRERVYFFASTRVTLKKIIIIIIIITRTAVIALLHTIQWFVHNGRKHRKTVRLSRQDAPWHECSKRWIKKNENRKKIQVSGRRRRRLAGHLFQDRWKDQGRGFILLPPWPPNCLRQMLTVRDFSQHLVSSSKTITPNIPRGAQCMGHCEMMWSGNTIGYK